MVYLIIMVLFAVAHAVWAVRRIYLDAKEFESRFGAHPDWRWHAVAIPMDRTGFVVPEGMTSTPEMEAWIENWRQKRNQAFGLQLVYLILALAIAKPFTALLS